MHCFARLGVLQRPVPDHVFSTTSGRRPRLKRWLFSEGVKCLADTHVSRLVGEVVAPQQPLLQVVAASQLCKTMLSRGPRRMADVKDKVALSRGSRPS
jgi:hypothetical protein